MGKITTHPHDRLFKLTMQNIERAKEFLQTYLPAKIQHKIDFNTLELAPTEFIKKDLAALQNDMMYRCQIENRPGYLYNITEHASKADEMLPFRANEYKYALIRWHYENVAKEIPPVVVLCLYHGKESPYPYARNIIELANQYDLSQELLFDDVHIIDLNEIPDEKLTQSQKTGLMQLLMKYGRTKRFYQHLKSLAEQGKLTLLLKSHDHNYLYGIIVYTSDMLSTGQYSAQDVVNLYAEVCPELKDNIMTITQQLRQEGMQEGILLGKQQGILQTARNLLQQGIDLAVIRNATGLNVDQLKNL